MKLQIENIDKLLESKVRLGVMAILSVNESIDYTSLRNTMAVTDGNLVTHLRTLENAGYITSVKQFIGRKPNTTYRATETGLAALHRHLEALEEMIAAATHSGETPKTI